MKRIRIGKDISMRWEITTDGVAIPLDGRDLTVEIKSPNGIENNIPYRIDGNILIMTYYGYEQKMTGEYSITLWEKKGKPGQNVVDVIRAFELVRTSQKEDDFVGGDLQIESVDLGTENFDILTEGGYRGINIDTLQAEALEDSVNINGKTYSNESFTITLPKANLDSAGVMSADDKQTLQEHGNSISQLESTTSGHSNAISQINAKLDEHTESINAKITTDRIEDGAVTIGKLEQSIQSLITNISKNASFAGIATPTTNPGIPDGPVFYLAIEPGVYSNFGGISVADGEAVILEWKGNWVKKATSLVPKTSIINLNRGIISSEIFRKGQNIAFSKDSFFKFGFYTQQGTFTECSDANSWGWKWNLVFIPVIKDINFKVKTSNKPSSDVCKIFFVGDDFSVNRKIDYNKNEEIVVTSQEGDAYIAVQYSDDMYVIPDKTYKFVTSVSAKLSATTNTIPLSTLYHKNNNLVENPFNFSRFGYYSSINAGTSFSNEDDSNHWGMAWSVIFIPVKTGVIYNVTNAKGPDKQRKIVMVDINLKVNHGIENTENEITALEGDIYLAVAYGATVKCSNSYYIDYNRLAIKKQSDEAKATADEAKSTINGLIKANTDFLYLGEIKTGYYDNAGHFEDTSSNFSDWKTIIIPIEPLKTYKWSSYYGIANANHAILNENKKVVKLLPITTTSQYREEQTLLAEAEHYYFALQTKKANISNSYFKSTEDIILESISLIKKIEKNTNDIEQVKESIGVVKKDFSVINIPYIFGLVNSALYSREYVVRLFPESFLDVKPEVPALVNYRRDVAISRQRKTTAIYEKITKKILLSANGYNDKTVSLDFHVLNEKVFENKNIRICLFGVSFDSIDYKNDDGSNEEGGTMTAALLEKYIRMSAKDNDYTVNYVSIGTLGHGNGDTFQYNGETLNSRGKHEARGGHNGVCYLRQPMNFSPTNVDYDPNVSGTSATGLIQWLMNGLRYRVPYNQEYSTAGTDYGTFEKTAEKLKALRYTPFGKYHHDYAEELWEFCNKKGWIDKVSGSYSAWTGSAEQKQIIDKCMDYVAENPDYPFFDRDTARQTSYTDGTPKDILDKTQYALNYNKYLERYRTMDDLGARLSINDENPAGKTVEGTDSKTYTVGSKVTSQALLERYDVCKPTHVIWDMMFNDWGYYGSGDTGNSDGTDALEMTELFIEAIKKQLGEDIIFGLKAKKSNGAFFPDVWGDICLGQSYSPQGKLVNYNKLLISKYSDLSQKVSWVPIFPASIPFATNFTQEFDDFVYDKILVGSGETYSSTSDVTHEGLRSAKSMTYQIYGWLAYTIKD